MALFTAYVFELHQDQIYNVPVFMATKIIKNFNFQKKEKIILTFVRFLLIFLLIC